MIERPKCFEGKTEDEVRDMYKDVYKILQYSKVTHYLIDEHIDILMYGLMLAIEKEMKR